MRLTITVKLTLRLVNFMGLVDGNSAMKFTKASFKTEYGQATGDGFTTSESITKVRGKILPKWAMVNRYMQMASFKRANGYMMNM